MISSPWNDVAITKLSNVLGRARAEDVMSAALSEIGLPALTSADDLYRFARRLARAGGFVAAVGGLLSVHAVIHGATERPSDAP